jgi:hypothetical protein
VCACRLLRSVTSLSALVSRRFMSAANLKSIRFNEYTLKKMVDQLENDEEIDKIDLKLSTLKPLVVDWCYQVWDSLRKNRDYVVHAWESLFKHFDPFDKANQLTALRESSSNQLRIEEKFEAEDDDEGDAYESEDEDEEKDELDIMKEIQTGTRRSTRAKKQPQLQGYMVRTDQIQMEDDPQA